MSPLNLRKDLIYDYNEAQGYYERCEVTPNEENASSSMMLANATQATNLTIRTKTLAKTKSRLNR